MTLDESQLGVVAAVKATYDSISVGTLLSGFHGSHEVNPLRNFIRDTLIVDSPHGSTIGLGLSLALATSIIAKPEVDSVSGTVREFRACLFGCCDMSRNVRSTICSITCLWLIMTSPL
jgi:hypothetical protein